MTIKILTVINRIRNIEVSKQFSRLCPNHSNGSCIICMMAIINVIIMNDEYIIVNKIRSPITPIMPIIDIIDVNIIKLIVNNNIESYEYSNIIIIRMMKKQTGIFYFFFRSLQTFISCNFNSSSSFLLSSFCRCCSYS